MATYAKARLTSVVREGMKVVLSHAQQTLPEPLRSTAAVVRCFEWMQHMSQWQSPPTVRRSSSPRRRSRA